MKYKELNIILSNGMVLNQKDIAKITGCITQTNKKIKFEIDLNDNKDVYKLYKNFKKELEKSIREIQKTVK